MILTSSISVNQNICGCDGSLAIYAMNGNPPYSYSVDNGLSFKNTPLFTNLCPGQYSVIVKDISGFTSTSFVNLLKSNDSITYNVSLVTNTITLVDNGITLTKKYETTLSIFPALPSGTSITFSLTHSNNSKSSPYSGSSTSTSVSSLEKNNIVQSITYSGVSTGSTFNEYPGCQNQLVYLNTITEGWNGLTYINTDNFKLTTITSTIKNQDIPCYLGQSIDTYSLSNVSISGCYCCNVNIT
jgi:hypothetical protein